MMRPLPRPVAPVEFYLAAVVDRLDQLTAEIRDLNGRLGPSTQPPTGQDEQGGVLRLLEPDTGPEPAGPARLREPDIPEPPRHGKGSSRQVWAEYARKIGVVVSLSDRQGDIIAAVDAAKQAAA